MDINLNYSDDEEPLRLKSDFVLSLCELIIGGKTGLEAVEKSIIDRCVKSVYTGYFADPKPENMSVLEDLYKALLSLNNEKAERIALALEIYVTGSLNVFNHRTNIDISNRIVCFDIKALGKSLEKIAMLILQDQIWNRVTANRDAKKSTWIYFDEIHLLLKDKQTAMYCVEIWKRFRKFGGMPTALTQNVKDLLTSPEIQNIFENSDFIYMLSQAAGDRQILAKQLGISPHQLSYVTNANAGEGLLFYGNTIIPFADRFDRTTMLYSLLTSKMSEAQI
jgi:type IV secretory pathway VirB4 component